MVENVATRTAGEGKGVEVMPGDVAKETGKDTRLLEHTTQGATQRRA